MKYQKVSKEKILESAAKVIAEKGLDKISVDDIVKEAGVAKGSIYFYFKSKDELLVEAIKHTASLRIEKIKHSLQDIKSPTQKLEKLFKANNQMLKKDYDSFLMNYALLLSSHRNIKKEVAMGYIQQFIIYIAEIINEGMKSGQFRKANPYSIATILVLSNDLTGLIGFREPKLPKTEDIFGQIINLLKK